MAKPRERMPAVELSSAFQKKANLEFQRLRDTVARNLKEEMLGLLEDEIHSDLLITNGKVSVRAHKCIVQARCRHLWQENWLTQILDPDSDSEISCLEMTGLSSDQLAQFSQLTHGTGAELTNLLLHPEVVSSSVCSASDLVESQLTHGTGAELTNLLLHPEVVSSSVCSASDLVEPQLTHGTGAELTNLLLHPEVVSSSVCSANDLLEPQLTHGTGAELTNLLVHPEVVHCSVSSFRDLETPLLLHEVSGCSILDKDRLELLDYLQLEAEIVNSADDTSVDTCVGQDFLNLDVSKSLTDNAGKRNHEVEDGYLRMTSQILTEPSEPVSHEKTPLCDLVTSDAAPDEYKTCSPLGRDLLNMYLHKDNCDCCLSVDGVHFMAHKCVLSARCEYFLAMFGGQWSESQMATVNLEAVTPQAVKQLLLFLYGGVISLCVPSNLKELFIIADMYGVLTFRTVLAFYVKKDLCHFFHKPCPACVTTTSEALVLCYNFHLEDLQARCLKWISKYFTKVWPTKTFSALEDSIHQLCFESILSEITPSNVLDIIIECNKLISSLPRIKWTETVLYLVTRLMDAAIEYTSSHFVDVLKTKEFLLWAQVASWKASVLEEILYSVINSLSVGTACQVFQTLIKLEAFHSNPESSDEEITALLQAMIKCCEKFFRTHIHHVTRSKQWAVLPQQIQLRILEIASYVYLPEPPGSMSSRSAASKLQVGKHERTLPIGITGARNRSAASSGAISAPTRTGLISKTSPHSGRRTDKSRETRMSRSISESSPSRSQKIANLLKGTEVKVRASSRDRHRFDSSVQARSLDRIDSENEYHLFEAKLMYARVQNQRTMLQNASHFGYQAVSQGSRPGANIMSKLDTKKGEVCSLQDRVRENVLEAESPINLQQVSHSLKLTLSSQSKPGNGAKKLSPVGQKSHMTSKLPTLIRSQRQTQQQSVCSAHEEAPAPEHSSSSSIEKLPSESSSSANNEVIASDCVLLQSNEAMPSSTSIEGIPPEFPASNNSEMTLSEMMPSEMIPSEMIPSEMIPSEMIPSEMIPSEMIPSETILSEIIPSNTGTTSSPVISFSTVTSGKANICVKNPKDRSGVLPAALPAVDPLSDLPSILPEPASASNKDITLNLSQDSSDHHVQPADCVNHLLNKLHKDTSHSSPENSGSSSQQLSTADVIATLDFKSYPSDVILSDRVSDGHLAADLETPEVEAEVKIVHMSKTLNVGFIVPPD
ncbi:unnamed protein product [Candidula unifasciata]|uniref:BTB domain-containing protein n=1 Tax=Candidula unifasciata TaxID=100452 RepID=A0A8S3ZU56_9EUPU|nr:unnamed protein product [Candidula unifasciata]